MWDPVTLELLPGREEQHSERLALVPRLDLKISPTAAVYGPNASGKSNLIEGLSFLKKLVLEGREPKESVHNPFHKLRGANAESTPTRFEIDFLAPDDQVYRYLIEVTSNRIERETLALQLKTTETILFDRNLEGFDLSGLQKVSDSAKRKLFIEFTAEGTRDNQPFLAEAMTRDVHELVAIYEWFGNCLQILSPDSRPVNLEHLAISSGEFRDFLSQAVSGADTGIAEICLEAQPLHEVRSIPTQFAEKLNKEMPEDSITLVNMEGSSRERFLVSRENGEMMAHRLCGKHRMADGSLLAFEPEEESDGTRRFIDLAVMFFSLAQKNDRHVYVVDELDRSLHPTLCRRIIENFLSQCSSTSRSQFIITTHDVTLMTQELFRRDELWLMEKNQEGASELVSIGDFKGVRSDKKLRRSYLDGRFGGVPVTTWSMTRREAENPLSTAESHG